ncbi:MAG: hypothetical protein WC980_09915 [Candidatus Brocadiia bacterium]
MKKRKYHKRPKTWKPRSKAVEPSVKDPTCRHDISFDPDVPYLAMTSPDSGCLHYNGKETNNLSRHICWLLRGINEEANDYRGTKDHIYINRYQVAKMCGWRKSIYPSRMDKSMEKRADQAIRDLDRHLQAVGLPAIGRHEDRKGYPCPIEIKNIAIEYPLSINQIEDDDDDGAT